MARPRKTFSKLLHKKKKSIYSRIWVPSAVVLCLGSVHLLWNAFHKKPTDVPIIPSSAIPYKTPGVVKKTAGHHVYHMAEGGALRQYERITVLPPQETPRFSIKTCVRRQKTSTKPTLAASAKGHDGAQPSFDGAQNGSVMPHGLMQRHMFTKIFDKKMTGSASQGQGVRRGAVLQTEAFPTLAHARQAERTLRGLMRGMNYGLHVQKAQRKALFRLVVTGLTSQQAKTLLRKLHHTGTSMRVRLVHEKV